MRKQAQNKQSKSTTAKVKQSSTFAEAAVGKKSSTAKSTLKTTSRSVPTTMDELFASTGYQLPTLKRGQEVSGHVISVSNQELLIEVGGKSEGIVFGRELASVRDIVSKLSAGDSIEAIVLYPENDAGQVVLSLRKNIGEKRWAELEAKKQAGEEIEVYALEANRGGVICDYLGIRGFLPASQLAQAPNKLNDLIGKNLTANIIEVDRVTNRLIITQKQLDKKNLKEILANLSKAKIGEKYDGTVTAVLPFGIFVEIDVTKGTKTDVTKVKESLSSTSGRAKVTTVTKDKEAQKTSVTSDTTKLEGLVHVSELSWEKVDDPAGMYKVGDNVQVMVIAKDETSGRLNLSIRQLQKDPFAELSAKFSKDQSVVGSVSKVGPYGAFVDLDEGIEGFIHVSKIPLEAGWEVGKKIECTVDSVDIKARRIVLVPVVTEKPILYR